VSDWLSITLTEGKYHQVRKMVAAVHHKCIRLIRTSIENVSIEKVAPGEVLELTQEEFFAKLNL
jgi:23S rRNA pseudouridine2457 synthase